MLIKLTYTHVKGISYNRVLSHILALHDCCHAESWKLASFYISWVSFYNLQIKQISMFIPHKILNIYKLGRQLMVWWPLSPLNYQRDKHFYVPFRSQVQQWWNQLSGWEATKRPQWNIQYSFLVGSSSVFTHRCNLYPCLPAKYMHTWGPSGLRLSYIKKLQLRSRTSVPVTKQSISALLY